MYLEGIHQKKEPPAGAHLLPAGLAQPIDSTMHLQFSRSGIRARMATNALKRFNLEGLTYYNDGLRFEGEHWNEELVRTAIALMGREPVMTPSIDVTELAAADKPPPTFAPTREHLRKINRHTTRDFTLDELHVFERYIMNDVPSRTVSVRFTVQALEQLALSYKEGRSRLIGHDRMQMVGHTFDADVVKVKIRGVEAHYLRTLEYIPKHPQNEIHILNEQSSVYAFCSAGIWAGSKVQFVEVEQPGDLPSLYMLEVDYDPEELRPVSANEVSFVFIGALRAVGSRQLSPAEESPAPKLAEEESGQALTEEESGQSQSNEPNPETPKWESFSLTSQAQPSRLQSRLRTTTPSSTLRSRLKSKTLQHNTLKA